MSTDRRGISRTKRLITVPAFERATIFRRDQGENSDQQRYLALINLTERYFDSALANILDDKSVSRKGAHEPSKGSPDTGRAI